MLLLDTGLVVFYLILEPPAEGEEGFPVGAGDQDFRNRFRYAAVFIEDIVSVWHVILFAVAVLPDCEVCIEGFLAAVSETEGEVASGLDCGLNIQGYNDIKVGDVVEAYTIEEIKRTL